MATKLREYRRDGKLIAYRFYCPGCKHGHMIEVPRWHFDGNMEEPTFSPSLLNYYTDTETQQRVVVCHLFVTKGKLHFCSDCPHELKGQVADMIDFPEGYD